MLKEADLFRKFETIFEDRQAAMLAEVIMDAYTEHVTTSDFHELKEIVRDVAAMQRHTDILVADLTEAQQRTEVRMTELTEAQQRTEVKMTELAEAQQRTEAKMADLSIAQRELTEAQKRTEEVVQTLVYALKDTREELGGLSRSMSYALENEAYRALPAFFQATYGIQVTQRFVRTDIHGEEINFFGAAMRDGQPVLLVGETKLRLDERRRAVREEQKVLDTLDRKIEAVRAEYPTATLIPFLVTHYARPAFAEKVRKHGVLLVQSFEW